MLKSALTRSLKAWIQKSIPVVWRMNESNWLFQGTTRSTLTQTLSRATVSDPYRVHPWVRGAMESVALNIASCPVAWKNSQNKQASERDAKHWVTLFEKPNNTMGLQQLWEATIIYLLHYGECMWVLDRQEPTEMPKEIQPVNGLLFEPRISKGGHLIGWVAKTRNAQGYEIEIPYAMHEVVHFKLFNPYDPYRGLAPLEAAQMGLDQDYLASQYNKAFFSNSALPGGVIEIDEEMNDESFTRMKQQFQDHHQGVNKAHMLAILEGGAKYKQLVPSQKDMEFLNQKKWNRDEILACFKVPKLELGVWDDVNFAVAKVQAREFWVKTLIPKMKLIEFTLWAQLFSVTSTGNIFLEFDTSKIEALQGDMVEKVEMAYKLFLMGVPFNQLNQRFGLNIEGNLPNWNATYVATTVNQVGTDGKIVIPPVPQGPPGSGDNKAKPKKEMDYEE